MKRVTGLGGVFFKCKDVEAQKNWYREHLGIDATEYGAVFEWRDLNNSEMKCSTAWALFKNETKHFAPSEKPYMFNYRVENLSALFEEFKKEGVQIVGEIQEYPYGKFGWIMDPEGNKIELWEPIDEKLT